MSQSLTTRPVALITGASRGIGAATARELARRGYALVLAARSVDDLNALMAELTQIGTPVVALPTDMRDLDAVRQLATDAISQYGRVDVLINNAGMGGSGGSFLRHPEAQIEELLTVNLTSAMVLTYALLPAMIGRRSGHMIFVGSVASYIPLPGATLYGTSKFGLRGFAHTLRRELQRHRVQVTLISPGFIETAMTADMHGIPKAPVEVVSRAIANAILKPRREVIVPWFYHIFIWMNRFFPGLIDMVMRGIRGI